MLRQVEILMESHAEVASLAISKKSTRWEYFIRNISTFSKKRAKCILLFSPFDSRKTNTEFNDCFKL